VGERVVTRFVGDESFGRGPRWTPVQVAEVRSYERPVTAALPTTFMNESGRPVGRLMSYYKVDPDDLLVVHDDIDLPFGKLRVQVARSAGGHNGVSSVARTLGTQSFWRLKFGVGRPPGRMNPADFVLRRFAKAEQADVDLMGGAAAEVAETFVRSGGEAAAQHAGEATKALGISGD
jgi:PTH1 family peptidyl-tRNA hydrolase